jgi:NAD(P)H-hydrate epimerase
MKGKKMLIPPLTTKQMAEVDRLMIEVFKISLLQMMENAGRNLADLAQMLTNHIDSPTFLILSGSGNNGGGGLAAGRHLINRGLSIDVTHIKKIDQLKETPKHQWDILSRMGINNTENPNLENYDLIIDAMVGYGLKGKPGGSLADWIGKINETSTPVLSLDVPSGLDATKGIPVGICTKAIATLTLALPKTGLLTEEAKPFVGDLYLADISVPEKLYQLMGLQVGAIFRESRIIKITHQ